MARARERLFVFASAVPLAKVSRLACLTVVLRGRRRESRAPCKVGILWLCDHSTARVLADVLGTAKSWRAQAMQIKRGFAAGVSQNVVRGAANSSVSMAGVAVVNGC